MSSDIFWPIILFGSESEVQSDPLPYLILMVLYNTESTHLINVSISCLLFQESWQTKCLVPEVYRFNKSQQICGPITSGWTEEERNSPTDQNLILFFFKKKQDPLRNLPQKKST